MPAWASRAIAVAEVLRRDNRLNGATILPVSAARPILPGDTLTDGLQTGDVEARRRIEMRVRRRSDQIAGTDDGQRRRIVSAIAALDASLRAALQLPNRTTFHRAKSKSGSGHNVAGQECGRFARLRY
jgi:hypothetical protein